MEFKLSRREREEKARELLEVFGMWGIEKGDAISICSLMIEQARKLKSEKIVNILEGSGLKVAGPDDETIRQRIFHEPLDNKEIN